MLQKQIIDGINNLLQNYFGLAYGPLKTRDYLSYKVEGTSDAINHRRHDSNKIKVLHWFDDFYIYLEVNYSKDYLHKMISLSVFQGLETDLRKNQLFRAEWDDYNLEDETRPQPHWHVTRDKANYENFNALINNAEEQEKSSFELFEMSDAEIFDTKRIHFAMSGNWQNEESPVHKIDDAKKVVQWLEGLLNHIKFELRN
jgi:hypothetical protein